MSEILTDEADGVTIIAFSMFQFKSVLEPERLLFLELLKRQINASRKNYEAQEISICYPDEYIINTSWDAVMEVITNRFSKNQHKMGQAEWDEVILWRALACFCILIHIKTHGSLDLMVLIRTIFIMVDLECDIIAAIPPLRPSLQEETLRSIFHLIENESNKIKKMEHLYISIKAHIRAH